MTASCGATYDPLAMSAVWAVIHAVASAFTWNDRSTSLPDGSTYLAHQRFPSLCFALSTSVPGLPCFGLVQDVPSPRRCQRSSTPLRCARLYVMAGSYAAGQAPQRCVSALR